MASDKDIKKPPPAPLTTSGLADKDLNKAETAEIIAAARQGLEKTETADVTTPETKYSGVELAYDLSVDACESIIKRLDVMDGRLQTILAFAATTTAVVPSVANSRGLTFRSNWLYAALGLFTAQLLIGTLARTFGSIKLIRPHVLWERWLEKDPWLFKKDFVFFAKQHFDHNATLLRKRWWLMLLISLLFFIEVLFLVVWIATAQSPRSS
jgi:hypothetical protein